MPNRADRILAFDCSDSGAAPGPAICSAQLHHHLTRARHVPRVIQTPPISSHEESVYITAMFNKNE